MTGMESLLLIQTGGTIDKDYPRTRLGYAFEIGDAASAKILQQQIKTHIKCDVMTVCRKDSQDITDEDRKHVLQACLGSPHHYCLITHGTDTLIDTAAFLANHKQLPGHMTIVLTGAFKPYTFKDSDAEFNIGVAIGAMQGGLIPGVYVAMNGGVYKWNEVIRDTQTDLFVRKT